MDFLRHWIGSLGSLFLAPLLALPAQAAQGPGGPSPPPGSGPEVRRPSYPVYVIFPTPNDLDALLKKLALPDLELRRPAPGGQAERKDVPGRRPATAAGIVESVQVQGRIAGDSAILRVAFVISTRTDEAIWVPIRLDDQKLAGAREGGRGLRLQRNGQSQWEVELKGQGSHHVEVDLLARVSAKPARKALALAIPEASSTSLDITFDRHESDLIVGTNEVYPTEDLPDGKGTRLRAALEIRSRIELSWANDAEAGGEIQPLLSAHGEIAIDVDLEQMSTRSSWQIWCVRGVARKLQIRVDDRDEVTELRLDDQPTDAPIIEGARAAGRLTIPLATPLRPDAPPRRLVLRTRRTYSRAAAHQIAFGGFPLIDAMEQSGAIGITQSPNLWISPAMLRGLRRIETAGLPTDLRERPATRLAFEFVEQPFLLQLDVEAAPPLLSTQSQTAFRIDSDHARSEAIVDLQWVRGQLFEVELDVGPGLEVVSVGPGDMVEGWSLSGGSRPSGGGKAPAPRVLKIGLTPAARERMKASLQLKGYQRIPRDGPVKLGLFAPEAATSVATSYSVAADRGLSVELDDDSGQVTPAVDLSSQLKGTPLLDRPGSTGDGAAGAPPLLLSGSGTARSLPIRIVRHARSLAQQTVLSAEVSPGSIDLVQETTITVRHGTLSSLEVRVPAAVGERWDLRDHEVVDREELGQEDDGTRRCRLTFDRPVVDKAVLRLSSHLTIAPRLDATRPRDLTIPRIAFPEVGPGPIRLELALAPGIQFQGNDPAWIPVADGGKPNGGNASSTLAFTASPDGSDHPFAFKVLAPDPVEMPSFVVPRLLIRTVQGIDGSIRSRARYGMETHGSVASFALPEGARWLAARVDGRVTDRVDYDASRRSYRLRLPAETSARPALVELEYQLDAPAAGSRWRAPRLLDGGVVLETLWDVQVPEDRVIVGVPTGWSDENQWYWSGSLWTRRPAKSGTALDQWVADAASGTAGGERGAPGDDGSDHWLFSRAGSPGDLDVWILPRAGIVAGCSGVTLILGFLAIFARIRFRTAWAIVAILSVLTAAFWQPSVTWLVLQSAFMGAALTVLGLWIQRLMDRHKAAARPTREPGTATSPILADSSVERPAIVGSDDSTAIRVRVSSTMDYLPSPVAGPPSEDPARSSTLGRT